MARTPKSVRHDRSAAVPGGQTGTGKKKLAKTTPARLPRPDVIGNLGRMVDVPVLQSVPDASALAAQMAALWRAQPERAAIVAFLKDILETGRAEIRQIFESAPPGSPAGAICVRQHSDLTDTMLRALYGVLAHHIYPASQNSRGDTLSLAATGGYGRAELAPRSDIDLLFITAWKQSPVMEQHIEFILYVLWDLGFKVGQAVRSVDECIRQAKSDQTIRTAMLESRLIAGDTGLFGEFWHRFGREILNGNAIGFIQAKSAETAQRHQQTGDSRYLLEPNIKSGKGALRDLHTLFWIAKFVYQVNHVDDLVDLKVLTADEAATFDRAQNFFWVLRCHLHYLTGRAEDRLTFDRQPEIGQRMGYTDHAGARGVERFMRHYFLTTREVGVLSRIFINAIQRDLATTPISRLRQNWLKRELDGFVVQDGFLALADADHFCAHPVDMIRIFRVAQQNRLEIHPRTQQALMRHVRHIRKDVQQDPAANATFIDILIDPEQNAHILHLMNDTGVLGRFIPDWARVVSQMQYDMYHVYTVDEHSLRAVAFLHQIASGVLEHDLPVATDIMRHLSARRTLFVAMFLHDIAKGRNGDHSILGEQVALALGPRFGLDAGEVQTVAWLVREHLTMSRIALKRDLDDLKVAHDLAAHIQSLERLRLLLVLTVADINAVGPGRWNGWKAGLLRRLYQQTEQALSLQPATPEAGLYRVSQRDYDALRQELSDWPDDLVQSYTVTAPPAFWLAFTPANHARLARLMRDADQHQQEVAILTSQDAGRAVTEIAIYTHDRAGLFACLAGALAGAGANILEARIFTMNSGRVLDVFTVVDAGGRDGPGGAFDSRDKLARFSVLLQRGLDDPASLHQAIASRRAAVTGRTDMFTVPPRVVIDNQVSNHHTVIEVNGRDRPGFLYEVTHALTGLRLQISSAKIATYGEKVVDVFYVRDQAGLKITHEQRLQEVRQTLMAVLQQTKSSG